MGLYRAVILVATALVFVVNVTQAGVCKGRSTVLQIKIPNRTNVTIQYPNQNNPVEFVPYPYQQPGSSNRPECYTCRGSKCQRCDRVDPNSHHSRPPSYTKTNIIIDLTRDQSDKSPQNGKDDNDSFKNGTVIILQDKNAASSTSGSSAKGGKGTSASSSASTSIANTDIVASLNEKPSDGKSKQGNTEDIYVLDASKSVSASLSSASAGHKQKDQQHPAMNSPTSLPSNNPDTPQPQQPSSPNTGSPPNHQPDSSSPDHGPPSNNQPSSPDQSSPANQQPPSNDKSQPSQPDQHKHDPEDSPSDSHVHKVKAEVETDVTAKASSSTD